LLVPFVGVVRDGWSVEDGFGCQAAANKLFGQRREGDGDLGLFGLGSAGRAAPGFAVAARAHRGAFRVVGVVGVVGVLSVPAQIPNDGLISAARSAQGVSSGQDLQAWAAAARSSRSSLIHESLLSAERALVVVRQLEQREPHGLGGGHGCLVR
jgi:hypothetical protein